MAFRAAAERPLRQGDILTNVRTFELRAMGEDDTPAGAVRTYNFSLIVTQDCDLEQDYAARFPAPGCTTNPDKLLFGVLLCGVYEEDDLKGGRHRKMAVQLGSTEWKAVKQNQSPRYQYLGWVSPLGKRLVADFKDFFMVPCGFLYEDIAAGRAQRAVETESPYKEHLLQRFAWYLMRIGLPLDFHNLPGP